MKMKFREVVVYEFDTAAERRRINKVFRGHQRAHMLKVLELFEAGKFVECARYADKLGRTRGGYPEVEHVGTGLGRLLVKAVSHETLRKAKQLKTKADRSHFRDYSEEWAEFTNITKRPKGKT